MNLFSCVRNIVQGFKCPAGYPPHSESSCQDGHGKSCEIGAHQIDNQLGCLFPNHDRGIWLALDLPKCFQLFPIDYPARGGTENDQHHRQEESGPKRKSAAERPTFHVGSPIRYPAPRTVWISLLGSPSSTLRRSRWM